MGQLFIFIMNTYIENMSSIRSEKGMRKVRSGSG